MPRRIVGVGQVANTFANEWAAKGIQVNVTAPGYVAMDITKAPHNYTDLSSVFHVGESDTTLGEKRKISSVVLCSRPEGPRNFCLAPS